jgi:hypothetical protein
MKTTRQAILDQQALNRKIYASDTRYKKVYEQMQLLGIQDVTTYKQSKNGTVVWRLPILSDRPGKYIEYASFKSGYIRNQGIDCHSNWQINKRKMSEPFYYPEYEWKSGYQVKTGKYLKFTSRGCELIPIEIDRLEYMLKYIVKNEYIKKANRVQEGKFVPKWKHEDEIKRTKELHVWQEEPEVKVIVNGHRYNITP